MGFHWRLTVGDVKIKTTMANENILIFVNPKSGSGRSPALASQIIKAASRRKIDTVLLEPSSPRGAIEHFQALLMSQVFTAVISIGGDGLAHLAIQILSIIKIPLYVVPAGTGNDFARSNSLLSTNPEEILDYVSKREPKMIDLGEIEIAGSSRRFGQILSTGFDAQVNERANQNRIVKGRMKYNFATLAVLPKFKPISYELEIDGVTRKLSAMLVAVANGATYGGGMKLCPMAKRNDGLLDVMILHPVSKIELLKVFPKVYSGRHVGHPAVEFIQGKKISISAETVAYADGERIGNLPISVSVLEDSLMVWAVAP